MGNMYSIHISFFKKDNFLSIFQLFIVETFKQGIKDYKMKKYKKYYKDLNQKYLILGYRIVLRLTTAFNPRNLSKFKRKISKFYIF